MDFRQFSEEHKKIFEKELEQFLDKEINQVYQKTLSVFYSIIKEYSLSGGKRLRPLALILSYLSSGGKDKSKILLPAIAIELHHTYSLILDDIMDEDEFRRNNPTVYKMLKTFFLSNFPEKEYQGSLFTKDSSRFAVSFAMMLGNLTNILSKKSIIYSEFSDELKLRAITSLEDTDREMYHGQMMDVLGEFNTISDERTYLDMIKLKTGVLFGTSFKLGALFSGCDENKIELFNIFGIDSAMGFQLQDDIIDILGDKGHELGSDIKKGKKTLLAIKTLEKADETQKKEFLQIFNNKKADESAIKRAICIIKDTGALDYCKRISDNYMKKSSEDIRMLKLDIKYNELFKGILASMYSRYY